MSPAHIAGFTAFLLYVILLFMDSRTAPLPLLAFLLACVVAPFLNLRDCQDILYQVHFFNAPPSPWPEVTTMAVLDVEDAESDDAVCQSRLDPTE